MARIITKELALKIVKKLNAVAIKSSSKAHDDSLKNDLHISPRQAKDLGQCPLSRDEYIAIMRENGILPMSDAESDEVNP